MGMLVLLDANVFHLTQKFQPDNMCHTEYF